MNGATVGAAAALGMQLGNLLWDAFLVVMCLFGACLLAALVFEGLVIWDMLRKPKRRRRLTTRSGCSPAGSTTT